MNDASKPSENAGVVGTHTVEIIVAFALLAFGAVVVSDSVRIGKGWAPDGPEPGFYPFYVGLALCAASGWVGIRNLRKGAGPAFIGKSELRRVAWVLLPSAAYVVSLFWLGLYLASLLFLIGFMHYLGKYAWLQAVALSAAVVAVLFALFELWLQVPLPKGPIEAWLGF